MNTILQQEKSANSLEFIFGGTFDPIHLGHLAIIERLHKLSPETQIRLIPCAIPPIKLASEASFEQRIAMIQLAIAEQCPTMTDKILIDEREANSPSASYTIKTLSDLKQQFPNKHFILVIGEDNLASFQQWHLWDNFNQICHLLVFNRPNVNLASLAESMQLAHFKLVKDLTRLAAEENGLGFCVNMPEMPQSSSQIREMIKNNEPLDFMLPPSVIEYIKINPIYFK